MKNFILCILDSLRYDVFNRNIKTGTLARMGLLQKINIPNLDKLLEVGKSVPNMHATWVGTPPSVTSILTGLYPREHGVYASVHGHRIHDSVVGLEKNFSEAGFQTILWSNFLVGQEYIIKGKERFDELRRGPAGDMVDRVKELNRQGKKVFVLFHVEETHGPYLMSHCPPTKDYHDRIIVWTNTIANIVGVKKIFDRSDVPLPKRNPNDDWEINRNFAVWDFQRKLQLGSPDWLKNIEQNKLLIILGMMYIEGINHYDAKQFYKVKEFLLDDPDGKDTGAVITSDHGQSVRWRDNKYMTFYHAGKPNEDLIHVPAFWINSDISQSDLDRWKITSSVDIAPTVVKLLNLPGPKDFSGYDLTGSVPEERFVYSEFSKTNAKRSDNKPSFSVLDCQTILSSDGYKLYRLRSKVDESDYKAPLEEFLFRVLYKIEGNLYGRDILKPIIEKFATNDNENIRRLFVEQKYEQIGEVIELFNWIEDYEEINDLNQSEQEKYRTVINKLDDILFNRFENMFDNQIDFGCHL